MLVILRSSEGYGWDVWGSPSETYYTISDLSRTKLFAEGTLCGSYIKDACLEKLVEGEYVFRVGGNGDDYKALNTWEFCGVTGVAQQELRFTWENGECTAGTLVNAGDKVTSADYAEESDDGLEKPGPASEETELTKEESSEVNTHNQETSIVSASTIMMGMLATASVCGVLAIVVVLMSVFKIVSKRSQGLEKVSQVDEDAAYAVQGSAHGVAAVNKGLASEAPATSLVANKHPLIASLDL